MTVWLQGITTANQISDAYTILHATHVEPDFLNLFLRRPARAIMRLQKCMNSFEVHDANKVNDIHSVRGYCDVLRLHQGFFMIGFPDKIHHGKIAFYGNIFKAVQPLWDTSRCEYANLRSFVRTVCSNSGLYSVLRYLKDNHCILLLCMVYTLNKHLSFNTYNVY